MGVRKEEVDVLDAGSADVGVLAVEVALEPAMIREDIRWHHCRDKRAVHFLCS